MTQAVMFDGVHPADSRLAGDIVEQRHYLRRRPPISHAFTLSESGDVVGVCTFGCPPSREAQLSVSPSDPSLAIELNRLWIDDDCDTPASWFVARCLRRLPPLIVFSYADPVAGHHGGVYRAMSWNYAGRTDQDRRTPRFDYVPRNGKHSRDAFRSGEFDRVRRVPKFRYWTTTGSQRQRKLLARRCGWPSVPYEAIG